MNRLFSQVRLTEIDRDIRRNIVSIRQSQDLFDDLSDKTADWTLAQAVEIAVKPPLYASKTPVIDRPFETADWCNAIDYPFKHWQYSRYSDGSFGVWYGCDSIETTVYETVYHWYHGLLADAHGYIEHEVVADRRIYWVACHAALLDFRSLIAQHPELIAVSDYTATHAVGARMHREGHPGLITLSARQTPPQTGVNYALFNPTLLSNPRHECYLTYRLSGKTVAVEKEPNVVWMNVAV